MTQELSSILCHFKIIWFIHFCKWVLDDCGLFFGKLGMYQGELVPSTNVQIFEEITGESSETITRYG